MTEPTGRGQLGTCDLCDEPHPKGLHHNFIDDVNCYNWEAVHVCTPRCENPCLVDAPVPAPATAPELPECVCNTPTPLVHAIWCPVYDALKAMDDTPAPATAPPSEWKPKKGDIVRATRSTDYFHKGERYTVAQGPRKGMSGIRVFGSTGIPVLTSVDVFVPANLTHRWNVEKADEGIRLCRGDHDRSQDCDWEYFRPADSPVSAPAPQARTVEEERAAFEKWAKQYDCHVKELNFRGVANQWTGVWAYTYSNTARLWDAWQARAAHTPSAPAGTQEDTI